LKFFFTESRSQDPDGDQNGKTESEVQAEGKEKNADEAPQGAQAQQQEQDVQSEEAHEAGQEEALTDSAINTFSLRSISF
jgi:hypothetical protein